MDPGFLVASLCFGMALGAGFLFSVILIKQFLLVGRPNQVLIFSGSQRQLEGGGSVGYTPLVGGGFRFRRPFIERVDVMDLNTIPIDVQVANAYSKGGIPLKVHAVANVKISDKPRLLRNAIERFLGRDPAEVRRVAKETLEGHLRGVLAQLTPEEVNEDRLKFAAALLDEAEEDFHKLGLDLDTLKIQNVYDDVKYLDSIGRGRIAEVVRDAEVAESNALAEAKRAEAAARQASDVTMQTAQTVIVQKENELRQLKAQLEAEARAEEERAAAAAAQARAEAEAELQDIRKKLEQLRLQADVVLPARADQEAQSLKATGEAATIEENGKAMAEVLRMMTDTWLKAGRDAKDIFLIQQIESVIQTVVSRVSLVELGEVNIIDASGDALPRYVASYPAVVRGVLEELKASTGVDIPGILGGAAAAEGVR